MFVLDSCVVVVLVFFFKQKTAYELRISDWSSDVCSSDLIEYHEDRKPKRLDELAELDRELQRVEEEVLREVSCMQPSQGRVPWPRALPAFVAFKEAFDVAERRQDQADAAERARRSEEHTSELQSLMRISYAVVCLKKKQNKEH